jgi:sugar lactone lactonase YvrE
VAVDSIGNVYVADTDNDTIRKVTPSGMVMTFAGKAGEHGNVDGSGGGARFNSPHGVAIDRAGNVFVADTDNHTIRRITPEGIVTTLAGTPRKKGSADGAAGKARFNGPFGVAVDDQANLYVSDTSNGTVRQIALVGTDWVVTTVAETASLENENGSAARFSTPSTLEGLAVDARGNIYVSDYSNRTIQKLTRSGTKWVVTDLLGKGRTRNEGE